MTKYTIFALAIASSGLLITPALAAEAQTRVVAVADLDLSTDRGRKVLEVRLARAAIDVCGEASDTDLAGRNDVRQCRDAVLSEAARQRDSRLASRSVRPIRLAAR